MYLRRVALLSLVAAFIGATNAAVPLRIGWQDLDRGKPGSAEIAAEANLAWKLEGQTVEISGYALPVDRDDDLVYEFMLVPWAGACSHLPAPPPNQAVLVKPAVPYRLSESYEPVSVSGVLKPRLEKTQLFIMDGVKVVESGYALNSASVRHDDALPTAQPRKSPWGRLTR